MTTMRRVRKMPLVVASTIIALVALAMAAVTHTGNQGTYVFGVIGVQVYLLLSFRPELRTPPWIRSLARHRPKRLG